MEFLKEHEEVLTKSLKKPRMLDESMDSGDKHVSVSYQTFQTLDVFSDHKDSLFNILDKCSTALGRRELRHRLNHPITCPDKLAQRYNQVDSLTSTYSSIHGQLKCVYDISRYHRKLCLGRLKPFEWGCLDHSNKAIQNVIDLLDHVSDHQCDKKYKTLFSDWIDTYYKTFKLEEFVKHNHCSEFRESPLKVGIDVEVDILQAKINNDTSEIDSLRTFLIPYCLTDKDKSNLNASAKMDSAIRLHITEKDGYYFKLTKTRAKKLRKEGSILYQGKVLDLNVRDKSSESTIQCSKLESLTNQLLRNIGKMRCLVESKYVELQPENSQGVSTGFFGEFFDFL